MATEEHKEIILEALNDYRRWFGAVFDAEEEEFADKLDRIDEAIDSMMAET